MTTELYVKWSHRNFSAGQWREAAERFLELQVAINEAEAADAGIDHDSEDFFDCPCCDDISTLQQHYSDFAQAFANLWAIRALKGEKQ